MADYFLLASTFDSAPLVAREASKMGTPLLLAKGSSSAEKIIDNENGFLADLTPEAWADKIMQIENNPQIYQKVKANCSSIYPTVDQIVDSVLEKYKEIIKNGKPKS